jgi:hypothetical protein
MNASRAYSSIHVVGVREHCTEHRRTSTAKKLLASTPIFNKAGHMYRYSSYCGGNFTRQPVSMSGSFVFVPGTIEAPSGTPFAVDVPEMKFRRFKRYH